MNIEQSLTKENLKALAKIENKLQKLGFIRSITPHKSILIPEWFLPKTDIVAFINTYTTVSTVFAVTPLTTFIEFFVNKATPPSSVLLSWHEFLDKDFNIILLETLL